MDLIDVYTVDTRVITQSFIVDYGEANLLNTAHKMLNLITDDPTTADFLFCRNKLLTGYDTYSDGVVFGFIVIGYSDDKKITVLMGSKSDIEDMVKEMRSLGIVNNPVLQLTHGNNN